ncbi:MAG: hypothetical protein VB071_15600, partial [Lawsonibacter sp.]|nr:hypothetical protein [Lawsonibacter sp.]
VISAGTAARSRQLGDATLAAQNVAESVEAASLTTLRTSPSDALGGVSAGFYSYDGSTYTVNSNPQPDRADVYYIGVSNVQSGTSYFNAMVTLKADAAYAAMNAKDITSYSPMDAVLAQSSQAEDNPDQIIQAAFQSEANVVSNGSYSMDGRSRSITLDAELSDDGQTLSATVTYAYVYTYSYDREEYDDFGNVETIHISNAKFQDSLMYTLFPQGYDMSDGAPMLYLLYYPWYVSGSPDKITVNNLDNVLFTLFLVKQWDPTYSSTGLQAAESTYAANLYLRQTCGSADGAVIYSNAGQNLVTGDTIGGVTYHIYQGNYLYVNGTFSGELVRKSPENRIYEVTVDLYAGDYTGTPVYSFHTTKLQ